MSTLDLLCLGLAVGWFAGIATVMLFVRGYMYALDHLPW